MQKSFMKKIPFKKCLTIIFANRAFFKRKYFLYFVFSIIDLLKSKKGTAVSPNRRFGKRVFIFYLSTSLLLIYLFQPLNLQIFAEDEIFPDFRKGKEQARVYFKNGMVYLSNHQYSAAKENFIEALAISEDFHLARKYLSNAYYLGGEWQEALNELEILEKQKKLNQIWKNRAEQLLINIAGYGKKDELTFYKHISGDEFRGFRFRNPVDVQTDKDGNIYILSFDTGNIIKFNPNGKPIGNFRGGFGRTMEGPLFFTIFKDKLYVSDFASDQIYILNLKGDFINKFGYKGIEGGFFYGPSGIAISKNEQIYVSDSGNHRIQKLSLDGKFLHEFNKTGKNKLHFPAGLTIDDNGDVYVVDSGNKRVVVFDDEGNYIREFAHPNMLKPHSIKLYEKRIYIADEINGIMIYNPNTDKWTKISSYRDETGKYNKILRPYSSFFDYTGSLYTVDYARHRVDVFAPKNTLSSNLNVFIEKVEVNRFPHISIFLRVKNRGNLDLAGIGRDSFKITENENIYPMGGLANMKQFNDRINTVLIFENSKKVNDISNNLDNFLGNFFHSFTVNDKMEVIRSGKDAEKVYSFGSSPLDIYAKIRKSPPESSNINLGKAIYQGISDLTPEIGPRAVIVLVTGENLPNAFNQYSIIRNIQFANAHAIPVIFLSLGDEGEMVKVYKDIANRTGGIFFKVPGSQEENNLYKFIISKSDKRYILSYKSKTSSNLAGEYMEIEVAVSYRDIIGKAQGGYFVPEDK